MAVTAFTLLIVMIAPPRPCAIICRAAACPVRNVPLRLLRARAACGAGRGGGDGGGGACSARPAAHIPELATAGTMPPPSDWILGGHPSSGAHTRMTASKSPSLISRKGAALTMPAFATATSSPPKRRTASATAASTWPACGAGKGHAFHLRSKRRSGSSLCYPRPTPLACCLSDTSQTVAAASMPSPRSCCSARRMPSASMSHTSTLAPARPRAWAHASPMPAGAAAWGEWRW